ncbi:MAG: recombinase family protein [Caldilineaceae bacterium]|nr:recombinase family protein [Caldilineaceae bacterium]
MQQSLLAGYAHVSTLDQNPELQLDALSTAGCERIFEDRASGTRADRPGLAEALGWMRKGDALIVWRLDRLGRSLPQLVATVRRLEEEGFGFRSLTEGIDTTTASGTLVFHVFGALAQFERDLVRERTMAGLAAARIRGRIGGAAEQAHAGAAPPGRGDAEGQGGLSVRQRRDPKPLHRPHGLLPSLPEGAYPGAQGLTAGKGEAMDMQKFTRNELRAGALRILRDRLDIVHPDRPRLSSQDE